MDKSKLIIRGLRKAYGSVVALDSTDIDVASGEFLTLLGPSGSGKTTLLMAVAGLSLPDSGSVAIDGVDATYLPPFRRDIGMVFQSYALFPHLSIFENVAFPLRMRKLPNAEIRREVGRALEIVHLERMAERLPRELSGGQQQRVALARCIVYRPSIILMDEPLGALDKRLRERLQYEIKRIHVELGTTILYVTHDQEEALAMSDRICLMNAAGVEQIGTPASLYFEPASVFAAEFFGEANIFEAKTVVEGSRLRYELADGKRFGARAEVAPAAGQAVKLMIRPERVRVLGSGETAENEIEAQIRGATMLASLTRRVFDTPAGQMIVKTLTDDAGAVAGAEGKLRLGWSDRDAVALTRESVRSPAS